MNDSPLSLRGPDHPTESDSTSGTTTPEPINEVVNGLSQGERARMHRRVAEVQQWGTDYGKLSGFKDNAQTKID